MGTFSLIVIAIAFVSVFFYSIYTLLKVEI